MSTIVMAACWPLALPPAEKAVLISLADQANDDGECWPSVPTMSRRTCLGERTVQRALRELEDKGLLRVFVRARRMVHSAGVTFVNRYLLQLPELRAWLQRPQSDEISTEEGSEEAEAPRHGDTPPQRHPANVTLAPRHGDTQTVIEPNTNSPLPPCQGESRPDDKRPGAPSAASGQPDAVLVPRGKAKREAVSMAGYLAACAADGVKPVPADDAVFRYAGKVGLPVEFVVLTWFAFKRKHLAKPRKTQRDWRQAFRNYVEGNFYRFWVLRGEVDFVLTTQGLQERRLMESEADTTGGDDGRA